MRLQSCAKGVHCVDLDESFPTHIYLQNLASIQPRTSPVKFARSGCISKRCSQASEGTPAASPPASSARRLIRGNSWGSVLWLLRSEVNNSLTIVNFFHRIQNFRQISDLFSQIWLKKRHTSLFSGIWRETREKIHQKFAEKIAKFEFFAIELMKFINSIAKKNWWFFTKKLRVTRAFISHVSYS